MAEVNIDHKVITETINIRLDLYLRTLGVRLSRSRLNALIKEGRVRVNGEICKPSYKVKTGDRITASYKRLTHEDIEPEDIPIDIIYEDEFMIVLNKQVDMVVHPARGNREGTLVNALLHHTKISGGDKTRPGVVHRLDKDTSGVIVFAKDTDTHKALSLQIEKRTVEKMYFAIVWGSIKRKYMKIDEPIGKKISNRKLMAVTPVNSRPALTEVFKLADWGIASALKVKIHTGRTHQIRVHLSHIGNPVIGDDYYGKYARSAVKDLDIDIKGHFDNIENLMKRQALHAAYLELTHPATGERMTFYAQMPEDMSELMEYLIRMETK